MTQQEVLARVSMIREEFPGYSKRTDTIQMLAVQRLVRDVLSAIADGDDHARELAAVALAVFE